MVHSCMVCLLSVVVFAFCAPAVWWHNGETVSGIYVQDKGWRGGGYLTWTRTDNEGREYLDVIPVALASDLKIYGRPVR